MENRDKLISHMLTTLDDDGQVTKRLTDWEKNFLESIQDQFTLRGSLTDKQFDILERIYTEKTA